uniref:Uncharacterized protein n=1 Tax=Rhizophora mucronata TaxID=61149 RepID=A0A2P2Q826_RHIMU
MSAPITQVSLFLLLSVPRVFFSNLLHIVQA